MPEDNEEPLLTSPLDTPELPSGPHDDFDPVQTLMSWKGPSRPFRKKDRSYYQTIAIIVVLLILIALLGQQFLLAVVLVALTFLTYVLAFIPPEEVDYKLSTQGITIKDHFYHWQQLDSFWFNQKDGFTILSVLTNFRFPAIIMLVLSGLDQESVKKMVARFLPFHEIAPKSTIEKWSESLQKHFPLEHTKPS